MSFEMIWFLIRKRFLLKGLLMLAVANLDENGANHPRKIFRRDRWCNLNGEWEFVFDDAKEFQLPPEIKTWTHTIKVPFAPESAASGIGNNDFHPRCWYRKQFHL